MRGRMLKKFLVGKGTLSSRAVATCLTGSMTLCLLAPAFAQKATESKPGTAPANRLSSANPSAPANSTASVKAKAKASAKTSGSSSASSSQPSVIRKIVSLAPSNTELIYSVGGETLLEGVSTYCEYPPEVKSKPKVGSFISVNLEKLTQLKPDLVLLVSGQEALSIQLKKRKIPTRLLRNASLDDIAVNLETIGQICSKQQNARILQDKYVASLKSLSQIIADTKPTKVFFCVWPGPVITVGGNSFLNDCITKCGGANIAASLKAAYPRLSSERLVASNPELVILPCEASGTGLLEKTPWNLLKAIKTKRYYFLPDREHDYLSRPTLRIIDGLEWLSVKLHPEKSEKLAAWKKSAQF